MIKQFRYSSDNLGYLIYGKKSAAAIDAGAVDDILSFMKTQKLTLEWIANTHTHYDHTSGNQALLKQTRAAYLDFGTLKQKQEMELEGEPIRIYHTPGHTIDSLTFHLGNVIITGDTLFNGTVGNCFTGDLMSFYKSIKQLMALPGNTVVYAGHDYVQDSMIFSRHMEPDNQEIDRFLERYNPDHVYSVLDDERKVNPYLRFNEVPIVSLLKQKGMPVDTEYDRWESLMKIG